MRGQNPGRNAAAARAAMSLGCRDGSIAQPERSEPDNRSNTMPRITPNLLVRHPGHGGRRVLRVGVPQLADHERHLLRRGRPGTGGHGDDRRLRARRSGRTPPSTAARSSPSTRPSPLLVNCADQDEIDFYWSHLTDGGARRAVRVAEGQVRPVVAGLPGRRTRSSPTPTPTAPASDAGRPTP